MDFAIGLMVPELLTYNAPSPAKPTVETEAELRTLHNRRFCASSSASYLAGAVVAVGTLAFAGCGNDGSTGQATAPSARGSQTSREQLLKQVETDSRDLCATVSLTSLARTYGGNPRDFSSVARAYAKQAVRPGLEVNAEKGCIAGMKQRGFK